MGHLFIAENILGSQSLDVELNALGSAPPSQSPPSNLLLKFLKTQKH